MKDPVDCSTLELPSCRAAERAQRYRQRQALKRTYAEKIKDMTHGEKGRLRRSKKPGTLAMAHLKFPPVTQ